MPSQLTAHACAPAGVHSDSHSNSPLQHDTLRSVSYRTVNRLTLTRGVVGRRELAHPKQTQAHTPVTPATIQSHPSITHLIRARVPASMRLHAGPQDPPNNSTNMQSPEVATVDSTPDKADAHAKTLTPLCIRLRKPGNKHSLGLSHQDRSANR